MGLLFTDGTLAITVKVKKIAKIFRKIPNCGDGELDAENEWHSGWVMGICRTVSRHRSSSRSNASLSKTAKSIDTTSCRRLRQLRRGSETGAHIQTVPRQLQRPRQEFSQGFRNLSGLPFSRLKAYIAKEITWQMQEHLGLWKSARHISLACACFQTSSAN